MWVAYLQFIYTDTTINLEVDNDMYYEFTMQFDFGLLNVNLYSEQFTKLYIQYIVPAANGN